MEPTNGKGRFWWPLSVSTKSHGIFGVTALASPLVKLFCTNWFSCEKLLIIVIWDNQRGIFAPLKLNPLGLNHKFSVNKRFSLISSLEKCFANQDVTSLCKSPQKNRHSQEGLRTGVLSLETLEIFKSFPHYRHI